jgi:hypothetical protein
MWTSVIIPSNLCINSFVFSCFVRDQFISNLSFVLLHLRDYRNKSSCQYVWYLVFILVYVSFKTNMAIWHQNIDNSSLRILRLTIRITNSSGHAMICMLLYVELWWLLFVLYIQWQMLLVHITTYKSWRDHLNW